MPKKNDAASVPANKMFPYEVRLLGIDAANVNHSTVNQKRFSVVDRVWIRHPSRRCDAKSTAGSVTRVTSAQNVEVDDMPRHVRDLRVATPLSPSLTLEPQAVEIQRVADAKAELPLAIRIPQRLTQPTEDHNDTPGCHLPRLGSRERQPARLF